jgi:hypothetical protein
MKNRNLIYILIIIAITSFVFFKSNQNTKIDTSDWQTYENNEYGYRFKYPNNLEVIDGKDKEYAFYESPKSKSTFIILPGKYFNIKHPDSKNPETFKNYEIDILRKGSPDEFGNNIEEIIQSFIDPPESAQVINRGDFTIAIYNKGTYVYIIGKDDIYLLYLQGMDSREKYVRGWLEQIDNPQLTEWVNDYPNYLKIFEGIYSTFEIIK